MPLPDPMPEAGVVVPTRATFASKGIFSAQAKPGRLTIYPDRVELKIMSTVELAWADIDVVDAHKTFLTNNLSFIAPGHRGKPTANVRTKDDLRELLRFLDAQGLTLSERARSYLG